MGGRNTRFVFAFTMHTIFYCFFCRMKKSGPDTLRVLGGSHQAPAANHPILTATLCAAVAGTVPGVEKKRGSTHPHAVVLRVGDACSHMNGVLRGQAAWDASGVLGVCISVGRAETGNYSQTGVPTCVDKGVHLSLYMPMGHFPVLHWLQDWPSHHSLCPVQCASGWAGGAGGAGISDCADTTVGSADSPTEVMRRVTARQAMISSAKAVNALQLAGISVFFFSVWNLEPISAGVLASTFISIYTTLLWGRSSPEFPMHQRAFPMHQSALPMH